MKSRDLPPDPVCLMTPFVSGLILVTHNTREFNRVPSLTVEDWA